MCFVPVVMGRGFHLQGIFLRRQLGVFFKQMAEILGIVAAAHLFCHIIDFFAVTVNQKLFCFLDTQVVQIGGKLHAGLQNKLAAYIVHIHKQMIFNNPFQG